MTNLKNIYFALQERIAYYKSKNYTSAKIEKELRLDIENVIDLLAEENKLKLSKHK